MCLDVMLRASGLQTLWVLQKSPALTLGHVALAPVHWQLAQDVPDPGGDDGEKETRQPPVALLGDSSRSGGRLYGADFADNCLYRDHKPNPG